MPSTNRDRSRSDWRTSAMRFPCAFVVLSLGSLAALSLAPEAAQGCHRRFHGAPVYYQPMPVIYCQPYYPPPMYPQPPHARPGMSISVGAYDDYFRPGTIQVRPGTTVRFVNYGRHVHTVTSRDG